ncbi:MAG: hypothetical protein GXP62_16615, partial [Oligoflexia bacterium]|nr:hypothetical protein [Oligoflexia bacterium]
RLEIFGRGTQAPGEEATDKAKGTYQQSQQIVAMLPQVNQAFRVMKLDTIGAQAAYLANAYVESDQFRYMTETGKAAKDTAFRSDPTKAKLDTGWLNKAAAGQVAGVGGYKQGGSINRNGNWNDSFIGRGPLQVTHDYLYIQTLAVLEKRLEELDAAPAGSPEKADAATVREALTAIKADPSQAANPKYTFLFSAAYMKRPLSLDHPTGKSGEDIASGGNATGFMGKQFADKKKIKDGVYQRAIKVLTRRNAAAAPAAAAPSTASPSSTGPQTS